METVFDHGMTKEEREKVLHKMTNESYFKYIDQNESYYLIAKLYYIRHNKKKMMEYVNKLTPIRRNDFIGMYVSELD